MSPPVEKKTKDSTDQGSRNAEDRISALPDCLLHQILSFLWMRDAIATSLLSRRWRYLWTSTPTLNFGQWGREKIDRALDLYEGKTIQDFSASPDFSDLSASHIDSWIRFAVRHEVKVLDLNLEGDEDPEQHVDLCRLHSDLFTCGSIEVLKLRLCNLNLPTFIHLPLLKALNLWNLELTDVDIKVLTSGCPLLEIMTLGGCNKESKLNIFVSNPNMKSLKIFDYGYNFYSETDIHICAPYVLSLELGGFFRSDYHIQNLSSIASVSIDFEELLDEFDLPALLLEGLLLDLSHAKSLKLCGWCVQVLALRKLDDPSSLYLHATRLELETRLHKWVHPGMTYLLRSSTHIESLIIDIIGDNKCGAGHKALYTPLDEYTKSVFDEEKDWKLQDSFSFQFSHLKTIKISGFMGSERFSSKEWQNMDINEFVERRGCEIELVRLLLKNSKMLDKMIISISKTTDFSICRFQNMQVKYLGELLLNLTKRLLLLPRASQNAEIVFS